MLKRRKTHSEDIVYKIQLSKNVNIFDRINNAVTAFKKTNNNSVDPNAFLRRGSRRMPSTWSTPEISDHDFYSGLGYAVINKRANRSVTLGKKYVFTDASESVIAKANKKGERVVHPYLNLIRSSVEFSERDFWYDISTYLDLEGVYYLMAVRTVTKSGAVGNIQKFTLLNPYNVRAVMDTKGNLGGYVEQRGNMQRQIPKEMIIPIRLLNPFDQDKSYSLADAARDSQFTMKQANDFAREAIDGNLNAPGIISSAIELPDDQFDNFVERIKSHGRGEPLFGNGAGTVSWVDMQADLDKAALDKINSINRDQLVAISGLSITGMGMEQTGTGREVSRSQKDDFTENAIMPQIENIIDALNLDYRKYYASAYATNGYTLSLDNPLEANYDAIQAEVDIRDSRFALAQSLVSAGYSYDIAHRYANGDIGITDIGEPEEQPVEDPGPQSEDDTSKEEPDEKDIETESYLGKKHTTYEGYPVPVLQYIADQANHLLPLSEKGSTIYSTESLLEMNAARKTVRISRVDELNNSLIAVVDDTTYIELGQFKQSADRVSIISTLNKRYKNQPVAIKKKLDLTCAHDAYNAVKNAVPDNSGKLEMETDQLRRSALDAEDKIYSWYVNEISAGRLSPHASLDVYISGLAASFSVYFTMMFPVYAQSRIRETSSELGINDPLPIVAMTQEIKDSIAEFSLRESTSHMNTIKADIENALANIRAITSDTEEIKQLLHLEFVEIQKRRAEVISNNAAARVYNMSNHEADLQILTRAGLASSARKVLYSLTGDPCAICQHVIDQSNDSPIPFADHFVEIGEVIEVGGAKMGFEFENITSGNIHPNCNCSYRLVIEGQ